MNKPAIDQVIKACKAFAPKEDTATVKATAMKLEAAEAGLGIAYINNLPVKTTDQKGLGERITASGGQR